MVKCPLIPTKLRDLDFRIWRVERDIRTSEFKIGDIT